jgi:hypothetical protein
MDTDLSKWRSLRAGRREMDVFNQSLTRLDSMSIPHCEVY